MQRSSKLRPYERGEDEHLTPTELCVIQCLADGMSHGEAAVSLEISYWTAVTHTRRARLKLGVHTSAGCVAVALRRGLIE